MNMRSLLALSALTLSVAVADQKPAPAAPAKPTPAPPAAPEKALSPVEAVISAQVRALPDPQAPPISKSIVMAISAADPAAQQQVLQGLTCLHCGWDFEAYRHFCAALKKDPECLMAHFGAALALIDPEPDLRDESNAAIERMLALVDQNAGTELERGYVFGLVTFLKEGSSRAADAYEKLAERFPNDPQLKLLAALFGRTGYDDQGVITPEQEKSEKILAALLKQAPDNPIYLYSSLAIKAEGSDLGKDLEDARKLVQSTPDYPPFQHLLGHYEWRCGNHGKAVEAFFQAGQHYLAWMKQSQLTALDCPGWIKSECYRAVALASKGDYPTALEVAKGLAAIPVPADRASSEGGKLLLWEGRTLGSRLLMRRGRKGDVALAIAALPAKDAQEVYGKKSLAPAYYQGLAFALEIRRNLEENHREEATKIATALKLHGERMISLKGAAAAVGERSYWMRAMQALEITAPEIRGMFVMTGPKGDIGTAFNWFRSACDRQTRPSMMLPPTILLPMETRLGDYYLACEDAKNAIEVLKEGNQRYPRDIEILTRLERAYKKDNQTAQATATAGEIETLKSE